MIEQGIVRSVEEVCNRLKVLKKSYILAKNRIRTKSGLEGDEGISSAFPFFHECHDLFYRGQDRESGMLESGVKG